MIPIKRNIETVFMTRIIYSSQDFLISKYADLIVMQIQEVNYENSFIKGDNHIMSQVQHLYGDGNAAEKIVKAIKAWLN